ncbi:MAG: hypothetical protein H6585_04530 [Flavobacteriales bacterium]|nr:hypothetical protein [Flavobacteriales bacterium]MCB9447593.1 hypothetical protein [Flavobacteriales bacterium]
MVKRIVRILIRTVIGIVGFFVWVFAFSNLPTRIYRFPEARPFTGDHFYNPYDGLTEGGWKIGNFHAHAHAWGGVTHGYDSREDIIRKYQAFHYDIINISDYMKIPEAPDPGTLLRVYEHGVNIGKHHQVVINPSEVNGLEFPLWQHIHNKQTMISSLKEDTGCVVALAHPSFSVGYSVEELQKISGYDMMEVLNHRAYSLSRWDAALSSGHPAWILADDDMHEIADSAYLARNATLVYAPDLKASSIVNALRTGKTIGVEIYTSFDEPLMTKTSRIDSMERITGVQLQHDTLKIGWTKPASHVTFIGQNGDTLFQTKDGLKAAYGIRPEDTYVRTEITFESGNRFFLNPIIRTKGGSPPVPRVEERVALTWIYRFLMFLIVLTPLGWWWRKRR